MKKLLDGKRHIMNINIKVFMLFLFEISGLDKEDNMKNKFHFCLQELSSM